MAFGPGHGPRPKASCSGCQPGTEVTVESVKRSIGGSFDSGTGGNLLLDLIMFGR